jgi:hypothetical protein
MEIIYINFLIYSIMSQFNPIPRKTRKSSKSGSYNLTKLLNPLPVRNKKVSKKILKAFNPLYVNKNEPKSNSKSKKSSNSKSKKKSRSTSNNLLRRLKNKAKRLSSNNKVWSKNKYKDAKILEIKVVKKGNTKFNVEIKISVSNDKDHFVFNFDIGSNEELNNVFNELDHSFQHVFNKTQLNIIKTEIESKITKFTKVNKSRFSKRSVHS